MEWRNSLFLFALCGLFPVPGCVNCTGLGFRLCFCGVNLSGLAETVTAGDLNDRHGKKILVLTVANIPHLGVFLAGFVQKSEKNAKIYVKSFGFSKISINFAFGFGDESNGPGRFPE